MIDDTYVNDLIWDMPRINHDMRRRFQGEREAGRR